MLCHNDGFVLLVDGLKGLGSGFLINIFRCVDIVGNGGVCHCSERTIAKYVIIVGFLGKVSTLRRRVSVMATFAISLIGLSILETILKGLLNLLIVAKKINLIFNLLEIILERLRRLTSLVTVIILISISRLVAHDARVFLIEGNLLKVLIAALVAPYQIILLRLF